MVPGAGKFKWSWAQARWGAVSEERIKPIIINIEMQRFTILGLCLEKMVR